jgi:hypothetical protein
MRTSAGQRIEVVLSTHSWHRRFSGRLTGVPCKRRSPSSSEKSEFMGPDIRGFLAATWTRFQPNGRSHSMPVALTVTGIGPTRATRSSTSVSCGRWNGRTMTSTRRATAAWIQAYPGARQESCRRVGAIDGFAGTIDVASIDEEFDRLSQGSRMG